MANVQISGSTYEYATVDNVVSGGGMWTKEVNVREKANMYKSQVYFSIRETERFISEAPSDPSVITVLLQFKRNGDEGWTTYVPPEGTLVIGSLVEILDFAAGVRWRAGCTSEGYVSGSVKFGFDW